MHFVKNSVMNIHLDAGFLLEVRYYTKSVFGIIPPYYETDQCKQNNHVYDNTNSNNQPITHPLVRVT